MRLLTEGLSGCLLHMISATTADLRAAEVLSLQMAAQSLLKYRPMCMLSCSVQYRSKGSPAQHSFMAWDPGLLTSP